MKTIRSLTHLCGWLIVICGWTALSYLDLRDAWILRKYNKEKRHYAYRR